LLLQYLPVIPEMPQFLLFALRSIFRHYYHYYAAIIVPRVGREDPKSQVHQTKLTLLSNTNIK